MDDRLQTFEEHRSLLFSIAYRMLGSVMEAEDVVQESYLRYMATESDEIQFPKAFLSTIVTRLALDQLKSARYKREEYIGPWLPEPVLTADAPDELLARHESISMAFLLLLETLSPVERAAFLLREVFDYEYGAIAEMIGKSEVNCRQIYSRAKSIFNRARLSSIRRRKRNNSW
ncbi:MAG: sigma-70 family RNA polymerase sigma factor [Caldilineaceae bacterium]